MLCKYLYPSHRIFFLAWNDPCYSGNTICGSFFPLNIFNWLLRTFYSFELPITLIELHVHGYCSEPLVGFGVNTVFAFKYQEGIWKGIWCEPYMFWFLFSSCTAISEWWYTKQQLGDAEYEECNLCVRTHQ